MRGKVFWLGMTYGFALLTIAPPPRTGLFALAVDSCVVAASIWATYHVLKARR